MKILSQSVMYENPLPQLRSRQCFFPNIAQMKDGSLAAVFAIGEAFESVDTRSYIVYSTDLGASWSAPERLHDHKDMEGKYTDYSKITALPDGRLAVMGYAYLRENPELPIGNPENGGVLSDIVKIVTPVLVFILLIVAGNLKGSSALGKDREIVQIKILIHKVLLK